MKEEDYRRVTFDITLAAARTLARLNPAMTFVYVSGAGTDSSERGRSMWARVKGQTENALLRLPFKAVMFRPAGIVPLYGITSKTRLYRIAYALTRPLWSVLLRAFPQYVTTTEQVGRAMLQVAKQGAPETDPGDPRHQRAPLTTRAAMCCAGSLARPSPAGVRAADAGGSHRLLGRLAAESLYCLSRTRLLFTGSPLEFLPVWVTVKVLPSLDTKAIEVTVALPAFLDTF